MGVVRQIIRGLSIAVLAPAIGCGTMFALAKARIVTPSNFPKDAFLFSVVVLTFAAAFVLSRLWRER